MEDQNNQIKNNQTSITENKCEKDRQKFTIDFVNRLC